MRIERERERVKDGSRSTEVTYCLTSLGAERAGPEQLLALVRNHWHIENRVHDTHPLSEFGGTVP